MKTIITSTETTEEFIARGGKIQVCDYSVQAIPLSRKVVVMKRPRASDSMMTAELFMHLLGC